MAEMAEPLFFDPPITKYMWMQGGILSKMNGDSDLLGNVVQDFTQAQKKKFNRLQDFSNPDFLTNVLQVIG